MNSALYKWLIPVVLFGCLAPAGAAPLIDPISNASVPAGKSLTIPVTASSANGLPLTYTVSSSTNRIAVELHTNNPFWKMSVVQIAASNAPGAFPTPFRGGLATVTNLGDMTFMLFRDRTPHTVDVVSGLTASGFYNSNTIFHRVVPGFVIQGGDPNTNGSGGPVFRYDDEFHPRALFSGNGQLALANSGKDTDGSQFFVTAGPQRFLDLGYTLFGQLLRGFNVMSNIFNVATNGSSRPLAEVIITRASLVSNAFDTVLTVTGTNLAGVAGIIKVIADDGAGGRTTNTFTATTVSDAANNAPAILKTPAITNLLIPVNIRSTNFIQALDLEGNALYYRAQFGDAATAANATNSNIYTNGGLAVGPNPGYSGPLTFKILASQDPLFSTSDSQFVTFGVGDTAIFALPTTFTTPPAVLFSNQLLATFTNGVANSSATNFIAVINWGDNSITTGAVVTNANGQKEVRGSHTFTNSGIYPIYVTIRSTLGAEATVVSTATAPPALNLTKLATTDLIHWPAWAASFQLQSSTILGGTNWTTLTNRPALVGYENMVTNTGTSNNLFFRLKR